MNFKNIIEATEKPVLYKKGTATMWTDEYISKQLLDVHLNPDVNLGSRTPDIIDRTIQWILNHTEKKQLNILDLGCGPGLYTEKLAQKGHFVTGVDFSKRSIEYARQHAETNSLDIQYIQSDYLKLDLEENQFDLVLMIYTDFGVLLPEERNKLLSFINKVLKRNGLFIFDVLNDNKIEQKTSPHTWEAIQTGFWRKTPYIALSNSFLYENEKVVLFQHIILEEKDSVETYRFWTHFFSHQDLEAILSEQGFKNMRFDETVLPASDIWNGENVTFCIAEK